MMKHVRSKHPESLKKYVLLSFVFFCDFFSNFRCVKCVLCDASFTWLTELVNHKRLMHANEFEIEMKIR